MTRQPTFSSSQRSGASAALLPPAADAGAPAAPARRGFLQWAGGGLAAAAAAVPQAAGAAAVDTGRITFPTTRPPTEVQEKPEPLPLPQAQRVGYALVGLGRLTLNQLLPAFGKTRYAKPVALVSGDRDKALKVARQYGIAETAVHGYADYERLADNPAVQVIYVVLPNGMHAEYVVRGARIGKHILCEKPMANTVAECRQMVDACKQAGRKLMVAYRSQYEPMERWVAKAVRDGRLGALREFASFNGQVEADPNHWRLKRALAGGGPLPDVGIYCLNAARYISGEEPVQVIGHTYATPGDARFREVEESVQFILQFPSGLVAHCGASYNTHRTQMFRMMGDKAWAEMSPAFAYNGLKLRFGVNRDGKDEAAEISIDSGDQFAREIDHMSRCVLEDREPMSNGDEGLQDMRIIEAIYRSAREGRAVALPATGYKRPTTTFDDEQG